MIKRSNIIFSIILSCVLLFSVISTGCNNTNKDKGSQEPTKKVYTLLVEDIALLVGYEYTPNLTLKLNGEEVSSVISFNSSNSEFVSVNNGKLKGEKIGQAKITAKAYVNSKEVASAEFNCAVNDNKGIHPLKSSYLLYVSDNVKGVAFETNTELKVLVYENGNIIENAEIQWNVVDQNVAFVDENNYLHAVALGETYVVGTYNFGDGETLNTIKLPVKVSVPVLTSNNDIIVDKQNEMQTFNAQEVLGKSEIGVISNLSNAKDYVVENNQIKTSLFKSGEHTCVIYDKDKTVGVQVSIIAADFVVYDNQGLLNITTLTDGYIALANDLSNIDYVNSHNKAFKGVFNGLGHTISNIKFKTSTGLFYNTDGATIKNVAIKNATLEKASSGVFLYRNQGGETIIDNTYVTVNLKPGQWDCGGAVAFVFGGKVIYSNSIIYTENFVAGGNGMVLGRAYAQLVLKNSFAIGNGSVCGMGTSQYNKNYEAINRTAGVKFLSNDELIDAFNKGKVDFSGFNKYWNISSNLPIM